MTPKTGLLHLNLAPAKNGVVRWGLIVILLILALVVDINVLGATAILQSPLHPKSGLMVFVLAGSFRSQRRTFNKWWRRRSAKI